MARTQRRHVTAKFMASLDLYSTCYDVYMYTVHVLCIAMHAMCTVACTCYALYVYSSTCYAMCTVARAMLCVQ